MHDRIICGKYLQLSISLYQHSVTVEIMLSSQTKGKSFHYCNIGVASGRDRFILTSFNTDFQSDCIIYTPTNSGGVFLLLNILSKISCHQCF